VAILLMITTGRRVRIHHGRDPALDPPKDGMTR
jgi:hypothetical protein